MGESLFAQKDSIKLAPKKDTVVFDRKKEIAFDGKRYRVYNNWLSVAAGVNYNTKWPKDEKNIAVDFSFHSKQHYFRAGGFLSGKYRRDGERPRHTPDSQGDEPVSATRRLHAASRGGIVRASDQGGTAAHDPADRLHVHALLQSGSRHELHGRRAE